MKKVMLSFCAAAAAVQICSALTVTGVTARQRWPWNSLVDVDFTVNGVAGEAYRVDVSAVAADGAVKLFARTFENEPIAASDRETRLVWNLGADYPGFMADDLQITVTATPFSDATPVYMVVDVSAGKDAASYPVRYTTVAPVPTCGQADPCKTTELWLKRVKAGTITMGSTASQNTFPVHTCTLTNDYYLGVFPLTQAQCQNIYGAVCSFFTNTACNATRPCDSITYNQLYNNAYAWPESDVLTDDCVCKRLRDRTGGLAFRLPTEWQWEYACRAGSTDIRYPGALFRYRNNSWPEGVTVVDEMWHADYGTGYVDEYAPNPWGFYDMLGNVWEWTVNRSSTVEEGASLVEPVGDTSLVTNAQQKRTRILRGGSWNSLNIFCCSYSRKSLDPWTSTSMDYGRYNTGARLCVPIIPSKE